MRNAALLIAALLAAPVAAGAQVGMALRIIPVGRKPAHCGRVVERRALESYRRHRPYVYMARGCLEADVTVPFATKRGPSGVELWLRDVRLVEEIRDPKAPPPLSEATARRLCEYPAFRARIGGGCLRFLHDVRQQLRLTTY